MCYQKSTAKQLKRARCRLTGFWPEVGANPGDVAAKISVMWSDRRDRWRGNPGDRESSWGKNWQMNKQANSRGEHVNQRLEFSHDKPWTAQISSAGCQPRVVVRWKRWLPGVLILMMSWEKQAEGKKKKGRGESRQKNHSGGGKDLLEHARF